jgi:hypothetical protein
MRIKELEDVLKLVDEMPRDRQLDCVKQMMWHVEQWEERLAFDGDDTAFLIECIKRRRERREAGGKGKPPLKGG